MARSIEPKILGMDSRGFSHASNTIKTTGKGKFWKSMIVQLKSNKSRNYMATVGKKEQTKINKSETNSNSNQFSETSTKWSNENEEMHSKISRGCSNGYYLIEGNKQVCFEVSNAGGSSPYSYMSVFHYDACPLFVGSNECLIKVEVSGGIYVSSVAFNKCLTLR